MTEEEFNNFVREHAGPLKKYLRRYVKEGAEDIAQEAFARLWEYRDKDFVSARAWTYVVARNLALDEIKRVGRHAEEDVPDQPSNLDIEQGLEDKEDARQILIGLSELPASQSEVLLRTAVGMTDRQIGDAMDMKPGAVRQMIWRGRTNLRTAA